MSENTTTYIALTAFGFSPDGPRYGPGDEVELTDLEYHGLEDLVMSQEEWEEFRSLKDSDPTPEEEEEDIPEDPVESEEESSNSVILDDSVGNMDLPTDVVKALKANGFLLRSDIMQASKAELLNIPGIGEKTYEQIQSFL